MTTKKPHASAGTKSPASSEESTASTAAKTAEKPPTGSVAGYVASASSKATKRAYASDVRHFIRRGGAIPATPAMVAEYLAKLAPAMKVATLERRCVSIAQAHRDQGLKSPTRAEVVIATMKGIRRQHGTRQRGQPHCPKAHAGPPQEIPAAQYEVVHGSFRMHSRLPLPINRQK